MDQCLQRAIQILLGFVICCIFGWPVMIFWNQSIVPAIDGTNVIEFRQGIGMVLLVFTVSVIARAPVYRDVK